MRIFFLLSLLAVPVRAELWSYQIPIYGSANDEVTAYRRAEQKVAQEIGKYRTTCEKQSGSLSSRIKRGFCTPYDPNSLLPSVDCLVVGYVSCYAVPVVIEESVEPRETSGNGNGFIEPGEKAAIVVTMKNSGSRELQAIKIGITHTASEPVLALQSSELELGNLKAAESKSVTFIASVLPDAPCGAQVLLNFTATGKNLVHHFPYNLAVGKLTEAPIILQSSAPQALTQAGINIVMGDIPGPGRKISQLRFSYQASVRTPSKYRLWLTPPNKKAIWVYYADESRPEVIFDRDITKYLAPNSMTGGKWHLSGDMGAGNTATLKDWKLVITPDAYECHK